MIIGETFRSTQDSRMEPSQLKQMYGSLMERFMYVYLCPPLYPPCSS